MGNPNAVPPEHTKWKKGQSGNPSGPKPGYKHLSTHIQEMLNNEKFDQILSEKKRKYYIEFQGAPLKAIIITAIIKAIRGDKQWADWLANNGYGTKLIHQIEKSTVAEILEAAGLKGEDDGKNSEAASGSSEDQA